MEAAALCEQVGRERAKPPVPRNPTCHRDVGASPRAPAGEAELIVWAQDHAGPHRRQPAVDEWIEVGSGDRDQTGLQGDQGRPTHGAFERGGTFFVAREEVRGTVREPIHRAARRDAGRHRIRTSQVLHGREETRLADAQHLAHAGAAKNLTRSPARKRHGGSESGRKSLTEVRPMRCHPPGVASG